MFGLPHLLLTEQSATLNRRDVTAKTRTILSTASQGESSFTTNVLGLRVSSYEGIKFYKVPFKLNRLHRQETLYIFQVRTAV